VYISTAGRDASERIRVYACPIHGRWLYLPDGRIVRQPPVVH
jgi:hypothetical protein